MSAVDTALATLARCLEALAGELTDAERGRVIALAHEARSLLAASAPRRRVATEHQARRLRRLDEQLADRSPGERRVIVCTRLGISRATYYRLKSHNVETDTR